MQCLRKDREEHKENWANAGFVSSHDKADMYQNAGAIAACSTIEKVLNVTAYDLFGDDDGE